MPAPKKYPDELRERAVRMGLGPSGRSGDRARGALARVGQQLGINKDTLRSWVDREEIDIGLKPGVTTAEQQRINELEREVRELRRANDPEDGLGFLRVNAKVGTSPARFARFFAAIDDRWLVLDVRPRRVPRTRGVVA